MKKNSFLFIHSNFKISIRSLRKVNDEFLFNNSRAALYHWWVNRKCFNERYDNIHFYLLDWQLKIGFLLLINSIHAASVHNVENNDDSTVLKALDDDQDQGHGALRKLLAHYTHDSVGSYPSMFMGNDRLDSRAIRFPAESVLLGKRRLPDEPVLLGKRRLPDEPILLGRRALPREGIFLGKRRWIQNSFSHQVLKKTDEISHMISLRFISQTISLIFPSLFNTLKFSE